jgi:IS4 transposase
LDDLPIEPGSFYVMDRGYVDSRRLRRIADAGAFFVIRERADVKYYVAVSRSVDRTTFLRSDQSIRFNTRYVGRNWPDLMRRVSIFDTEESRRLAFWTNQWTLPAATIAELYRQRWQIELFFRWVKQSLRIRTFYGTSPNAVRVQLWTAICTYLAIAITRKQLGIRTNLTTFVQVLSLHALSKVPLQELFTKVDTSEPHLDTANQLEFNDLC